jgi:hypothetical protein
VAVSLCLPGDGALVITRNAKSVTRTPLGPEGLELHTTKRIDILEGGQVGVDEVHWREEYTRYEIAWSTKQYDLHWKLGPDEKGKQEPIPAPIEQFGPTPPREVWITPDRHVLVHWLPWPEPEPDEDPKGKGKGKADKGKPDTVAEAGPEDATDSGTEVEAPPDKQEVALDELDNYLAGMVLAPTDPVKPGKTWSWTVSQKVTRGGDASNTSTWRFDRMQGDNAVLVETLALSHAAPPATGEFRITGLTGSGEMQLDTKTHLPVSYTSSFEAVLASPSARGNSSMSVDAKFRWKASSNATP